MNNKIRRFPLTRAYTLVELTIAMSLLGVVGTAIYSVLNGGMILFSQNIATNFSNLTVRTSSMRMVQDLHDSIGRPQLAGLNLQPLDSTVLSAPAIRFPVLLNTTPSRVLSDSSGNTTITAGLSTNNISLRISQPAIAPKPGDILVFPDITETAGNILTRTISAVTPGNPTTVTVKDLGVNLLISTVAPADPTLVYIARIAAYSVVTTATASNGTPTKTEVRFYPDASSVTKYTVVNNNLTTYVPPGEPASLGPFSLTTGSDPGIAQIQLISINADTGNRSFKGDRMVLSEIIPPKCLMIHSTNYN